MVFSGDWILAELERELKTEQVNSGILSEGKKIFRVRITAQQVWSVSPLRM